jgi:hypothetical protein
MKYILLSLMAKYIQFPNISPRLKESGDSAVFTFKLLWQFLVILFPNQMDSVSENLQSEV